MGSAVLGGMDHQRGRGEHPKIVRRLRASPDERRRLEACREYGIDPRTFDGEPTVERHEHYDTDGHLTGTTVVTRESPWDAYSRGEALADLVRRERIHPGCGNDVEDAFNGDVRWYVDHTMVCQACATRDMVLRGLEKQHEKDRAQPNTPAWSDGRIVTVRPASEADMRAATKGKAATLTRA